MMVRRCGFWALFARMLEDIALTFRCKICNFRFPFNVISLQGLVNESTEIQGFCG